jgi:predicted acylesterase/phospholipase RssA
MSTPSIQLAFQGGGAKLAAMLPVTDAFITAQSRGFVKIKAVSGTSAGAICAALVASNADMTEVRRFLVDHGDDWVSALVPAELQSSIEDGQKIGWWYMLLHLKMMRGILFRGKPVLNGNALSDFLRALLKAGTGTTEIKIEDCQAKLTIIASNIVASQAVRHSEGNLAAALTDSCSLPILFRSFDSLSQSHHVDGGICDNLPVEELLKDRQTPVFAVFPSSNPDLPSINNIVAYFLALLSASINHGVARSVAMIAAPFRFELDTDLGMLEFKKALEYLGNPDWYDSRKSAALQRIESFSKSFGVTNSAHDARVLNVIDVGQYEDALTELTDGFASKFEVCRARFAVRVNCDKRLAVDEPFKDRVSDTVTRLTEIKLLADDVVCYRANLAMEQDTIVPTVWSAKNKTKKIEIPIRALPLKPRKYGGGTAKHCMIQFVNPKKTISKGDIIEIRSVYHSVSSSDMSPLNRGMSDFFGFTNSDLKNVTRAELILFYPKRLGKLMMISHPDRSSRHDVKPIRFNTTQTEMIEEGFDAIGIFVPNLLQEEKFFALITQQV